MKEETRTIGPHEIPVTNSRLVTWNTKHHCFLLPEHSITLAITGNEFLKSLGIGNYINDGVAAFFLRSPRTKDTRFFVQHTYAYGLYLMFKDIILFKTGYRCPVDPVHKIIPAYFPMEWELVTAKHKGRLEWDFASQSLKTT